MKILILGAKGSLGQTFADLYKKEDFLAWDREELDIANEQDVMEKIDSVKPQIVINCAAYNAVDKAEKERGAAELVNGNAVGFIAAACKEIDALMVHFSTAYVFDGSDPEGYNEDDPIKPVSVYGQSKLSGEMQLNENLDDYYLVRTTWLYGRASQTGKPSFVDIMLKMASEDKPINAITDEFGQPTYVVDLAKSVARLIEQGKPFGIYHLTNTGQASWYDWAREIFRIKDIKARLAQTERYEFKRLAQRPKYGILNNTKFEQLRPWTEALKEFLITNS